MKMRENSFMKTWSNYLTFIMTIFYQRFLYYLKSFIFVLYRKLVDQYGNIPKLPDYNNAKLMHFESLSFYFLNILRNPNKHQFFLTTNIIERIEW